LPTVSIGLRRISAIHINLGSIFILDRFGGAGSYTLSPLSGQTVFINVILLARIVNNRSFPKKVEYILSNV
jgi:hypothetical protein